jgi:hypothetical protein
MRVEVFPCHPQASGQILAFKYGHRDKGGALGPNSPLPLALALLLLYIFRVTFRESCICTNTDIAHSVYAPPRRHHADDPPETGDDLRLPEMQ